MERTQSMRVKENGLSDPFVRIKKSISTRFIGPFQRFLSIEASGGILLLIMTVIALLWANSPWAAAYHHLWEAEFTIGIEEFSLSKSLHHWINDGLMAVFFFVVGLEIKRELITGELSSPKKASLPIAAAIGGMVLPAIIYVTLNHNPQTVSGWGVPMATDIAFSLGVLSLLGKRVPLSLKVFLVAFAIVDDLGAVLVIALFYSSDIQSTYLLFAGLLFLLLIIFNLARVHNLNFYILTGLIIWYLFLKSGLHPTLAGVLIAFTIPLNRRIHVTTFNDKMKRNLSAFCGEGFDEKTTLTHRQIESIDNMAEEIRHVHSPLQFLEHSLHRFVTFIVMPVFALANAGVVINGAGESGFMNILSLNIEVSLLAGKVLGILSFCWLAVKLGLASIPENVTWGNMLGIGFLGGMGFTMSLFISNLAFPDALFLNPAKIGILVGSFMAGILGYIILRYSLRKKLI